MLQLLPSFTCCSSHEAYKTLELAYNLLACFKPLKHAPAFQLGYGIASAHSECMAARGSWSGHWNLSFA